MTVVILFFRSLDVRAAGMDLEAFVLGGADGYRERTLDASFHFSPNIPWDDPDVPWPFNTFWFRGRRTGYVRNGSVGPTYRTTFRAGVGLFQRSSVDIGYTFVPALSEDPGAYRSRGWDIAVTAGWMGWLPALEPERASGAGWAESRWRIHLGRTSHEERVQISTSPANWAFLREGIVGASVAETLARVTTLRAQGFAHSYDRDVARQTQRREFFVLRNTRAAAPVEMLNGFIRRSWGTGVDQLIGRCVEVSGDWSRATYEAGAISRSDTLTARLQFNVGLYLRIFALHEVFDPQERVADKYTGFGVGLSFE